MPMWTWIGLQKGKATLAWPEKPGTTGQTDVLGMPRLDPQKCLSNCTRCVEACLPQAITRPDGAIHIDYGKCIQCQLCTEVCPTQAFSKSEDWAFGVANRIDLLKPAVPQSAAKAFSPKPAFKRSLHIRHIDAGSCNGCESELLAMTNSLYDLERLGIFFTASPRHADLLLVTGPVTYTMLDVVLATYEAMPQPSWVMAVGTCATSGGSNGGGYACSQGLTGILPVDLYLPGCPPNPAALISALLMFLGRLPQAVHGGQHDAIF